LAGWALCAGLAVTASQARAASFDCAKAVTPAERTICSSRSLSDLDVEMATLWTVARLLPMAMGSRGAQMDEQMDWTARRNACRDDSLCLADAYRVRVKQLRDEITAGMNRYCRLDGLCG
jgi:uncharacterized protein